MIISRVLNSCNNNSKSIRVPIRVNNNNQIPFWNLQNLGQFFHLEAADRHSNRWPEMDNVVRVAKKYCPFEGILKNCR